MYYHLDILSLLHFIPTQNITCNTVKVLINAGVSKIRRGFRSLESWKVETSCKL